MSANTAVDLLELISQNFQVEERERRCEECKGEKASTSTHINQLARYFKKKNLSLGRKEGFAPVSVEAWKIPGNHSFYWPREEGLSTHCPPPLCFSCIRELISLFFLYITKQSKWWHQSVVLIRVSNYFFPEFWLLFWNGMIVMGERYLGNNFH